MAHLRRGKVNGDEMRMKIFLAGAWGRIRTRGRRVKYPLGQLGETSREKPRGTARGKQGRVQGPSICHRTMLPRCRDTVRSAQKCGENCGSTGDSGGRWEEANRGREKGEKTPDKPEVYATNYAPENIYMVFFRGKHPFLLPFFPSLLR